MRHLALTDNHKYISHSDDLGKTCRTEQTSYNDSDSRMGAAGLFSPERYILLQFTVRKDLNDFA